jgi:hypothetical protein
MSYPKIPSIDICFSWLSGSSKKDGKGYGGRIRLVFNHILLVNLIDVEDDFRGVISPDLKVNIVLIIFYLS